MLADEMLSLVPSTHEGSEYWHTHTSADAHLHTDFIHELRIICSVVSSKLVSKLSRLTCHIFQAFQYQSHIMRIYSGQDDLRIF